MTTKVSNLVLADTAVTPGTYGGSTQIPVVIVDAQGRLTSSANIAMSSIAATFSTVSDSLGNVRDVPQNSQTASYILQLSDAGKHISITTGGITVPQNIFAVGDIITIFNNSGTVQTITQGTGATLRLAGTASTGNRSLGAYGLCTILCVASNVFVSAGSGLY